MAGTFLVNCDDFGMHASINEGICDLLAKGRIRSASLMAPGQAFDDAVRRLRAIGLDRCGVHLTLNSEYPRLPTRPLLRDAAASLCDSRGRFLPSPQETLKKADIGQVRQEFQAQMSKIENAGIRLTHIDGHMFCFDRGIGGEDIERVAREIAQTSGLPIRFRNDNGTGPGHRTHWIWEGYDDQASRCDYYRALLARGTRVIEEIIIHPAKHPEKLAEFTAAGERRLSDYRFFSSGEFEELIAEKQLQIVDWPRARILRSRLDDKGPVPDGPSPDIPAQQQ